MAEEALLPADTITPDAEETQAQESRTEHPVQQLHGSETDNAQTMPIQTMPAETQEAMRGSSDIQTQENVVDT